MRVTWLWLAAACGTSQATPAGQPPAAPGDARPGDAAPRVRPDGKLTSARGAIAALRGVWDDSVRAEVASHPPPFPVDLAELSRRLHSGDATATRGACKAWHDRIVDTIGPGSDDHALFGHVANLAHHDSCWMVSVPLGVFHELWSYLDAESGELLLMWITIEG
jgi:hypothetical protein